MKPRSKIARTVAALIMALTCLSTEAVAQEKSIVVASTTSTQDSGLFGYLLPLKAEARH
jgi:tungstate transport system substrate-binding protein